MRRDHSANALLVGLDPLFGAALHFGSLSRLRRCQLNERGLFVGAAADQLADVPFEPSQRSHEILFHQCTLLPGVQRRFLDPSMRLGLRSIAD